MVIHIDEDAELLRRYFHDIEDSQPLSREREVMLADRITKGDMEARDELVQANLRFVVDVARQFHVTIVFRHDAVPIATDCIRPRHPPFRDSKSVPPG